MLEEVERSVYRTAARYPAAKYAITGNWVDGVEDLVQEVVTRALIAEHQTRYLLETASDLAHFRAMLDAHTRHVLAGTRIRTVIDNLLGRSRAILEAPPFFVIDRSGNLAFQLLKSLPDVEVRAARLPELSRASRAIAAVPTVARDPRSERASMVYRTKDLHEVLKRVAHAMPCVFTIRELDRVFELTLTRFLPSVLDLDAPSGTTPATGPGATSAAARAIAARLTDSTATVVALKLAGQSDTVVAAVLGVSRPTSARLKHEAFDVIRDVLDQVDADWQLRVLDDLGHHVRSIVARSAPEAFELTLEPLA